MATPTAQSNIIRQAQRLPCDWPPAEDCHRTDEFPEGRRISKEVPEVRPNKDDDDGVIPERPRFSTQKGKRMHQQETHGHKDEP